MNESEKISVELTYDQLMFLRAIAHKAKMEAWDLRLADDFILAHNTHQILAAAAA